MPTIYQKTAKGVDEVRSRAHRLTPRQRAALILVDGERDEESLSSLMPMGFEESLPALLENGLIQVAATPQTSARPSKSSSGPAQSLSESKHSFSTYRGQLVRAVNELVGPMGENLAIKMEKAKNIDELRPLFELAFQMIASARGAKVAGEFETRFESF